MTASGVLSGRAVSLFRGPLFPARRATSASPGAIDPVPHQGRLLADGGVLNQMPVDAALFLGAGRVLAVKVTAPAPLSVPRRRFLSLRRAVAVMQAQLTDARLSLPRADQFRIAAGAALDRLRERFAAGPSAGQASDGHAMLPGE